uniref:Uncharacterized protein n=1 Tax=Anguilla anguilla TaxID=7936 RepID=A0A0E9XTT5_ANGAN
MHDRINKVNSLTRRSAISVLLYFRLVNAPTAVWQELSTARLSIQCIAQSQLCILQYL